ncbi:ATP-binding protein [Phenylobacterium sp.]|jgi:class 3 adenylate cyclase/tetratricopeptide (TPR) repeat protein|uniref:ATP-binding protein n=1 Tax=Phenylobacterium sp. TaxID=1871053 RepID=UPI002F9412F6
MRGAGVTPERRIVTVLAADIVGSTRHIAACDPDDVQTFFDRWFEHVRETVERAGGALVSWEGDGGLAVFGWPTPLEDHAEHACRAAWDIQRTAGAPGPDGRPVQFRVAVHSGLVALRMIRRGGRSRFDTVGAAVNIAAKLQQAAPAGGVLVSAQTVKLCRAELKLAPHELSGAGELDIDTFVLEARPEAANDSDVANRYRSPIVGRRSQLAVLRSLLPRPDGDSSAVAIVGEAGIGKSRLAAAAVSEALAGEAKALVFFGDAQKRTTPFAAARGLISDLLRPSGAGVGEALAGSGVEEAEVAALETLLTAPPAKLRDKAGKLTQPQLARALVNGLRALLADRPTVLLVEDLHLVDPESRQFLRLLSESRGPQPLCLLVTARPEALDEACELAQTVLQLDPLPPAEMTALGRQLWPAGEPPAWLLDQLVDRAEGIPFVLEELIRSVETKEVPVFEVLPHSVESVIHARLQRLTPGAKVLAQALSLLGEGGEVELVETVLGARTGELSRDFEELERYAFIHPRSGRAVRMRHQIIAEACANTIPRERRRQLHRTALSAITARYADLGGRHEQLAFHAEGAGDDAQALEHLWEAGLEARRNSAAASLNQIFDRALVLIGRLEAAAEARYLDFVLMAFASAVQLGELAKMHTHLPRIIELARRQDRPKLVSNTLSQLGMICWFEGRHQEGLSATEEGLAIARELGSPTLIYSNEIMRTNLLHDTGQVARAIAHQHALCEMLSGELETARLGAPALPYATALAFMSWYLIDAGQYREGVDYGERALQIAVDPYSQVMARNSLGRNLVMLERDGEAIDCLTAALEISKSHGYEAIQANILGSLSLALARTGRAREAVALIDDGLRRHIHLRTGKLEVYHFYAGSAEALVRHGRTEQGFARLEEALAIARAVSNPCLIVDGLGMRARLRAQIDPADARVSADLAEQAELCRRHGIMAWAPRRTRRPLARPA